MFPDLEMKKESRFGFGGGEKLFQNRLIFSLLSWESKKRLEYIIIISD